MDYNVSNFIKDILEDMSKNAGITKDMLSNFTTVKSVPKIMGFDVGTAFNPEPTMDAWWHKPNGLKIRISEMEVPHLWHALQYVYNHLVDAEWRTKDIGNSPIYEGILQIREMKQVLKILVYHFDKKGCPDEWLETFCQIIGVIKKYL